MKTSKHYPIVYIEWCDAFSKEDKDWFPVDEIVEWADTRDWVVHQVGFIIKETDEYLILASHLNPQRGETMVGGVLKIPKTWIKKRRVLQK